LKPFMRKKPPAMIRPTRNAMLWMLDINPSSYSSHAEVYSSFVRGVVRR